jgi:lysine/arginine/ornithine transport system substrate-binding protein
MKKLFGVGALALAVFGFGTAAAQAKAFTEIKFGVDATYPPFESMLPSGEFVGFDIDLGKAICSTLHVKCVFVAQGFDGIIPALQARKFDAILSSMTVTPDREKQIDFSSEMYNDSTSLVAKKGSGLVPTAASLKGKTVGVESGTIQETYADTYWKPAGVTVRSYPGQDQVYADLLSGRLDASLQDTVEATDGFLNKSEGAPFAAAGNPEYDPQDVLGSYIAIGLRKNETALKAKIDYAIAKIIKDGTYKKLESKYFNFDIYAYTPAK